MTIEYDWLRGCATALVTPFKGNGAVDGKTMRGLVKRQIEAGVRVLVPCGTTGESATMTRDEDDAVIGATIEVAHEMDAHVIAGVGSNATSVAIDNALRARALGADAVLAVAPYYNKPTQAGLIAHYTALAQAIEDTPVVLYNVPGRTASNINSETVLHLARTVPNIVAVKEASGDLMQIMHILRERPAEFRVLSGDDALTFALIALGADGLISVASNEAPALMSRMVEAALGGRWHDARTLHFKLLALMEANFWESSPAPVKAAMRMMGLLEENLRLPLVPVQDLTRERLRPVLEALGLLSESESEK
ncbi:MAG: 4-hydroxy-tetrahydrodipicolinate synthase [Pyrinomonadaceae bacterium MAG19_C2-C3]|nr:4-hydroxy-tetrahydrodipicolinate synthase [Pyrinomonadaceae bacterium MAG19_C2-C3]